MRAVKKEIRVEHTELPPPDDTKDHPIVCIDILTNFEIDSDLLDHFRRIGSVQAVSTLSYSARLFVQPDDLQSTTVEVIATLKRLYPRLESRNGD